MQISYARREMKIARAIISDNGETLPIKGVAGLIEKALKIGKMTNREYGAIAGGIRKRRAIKSRNIKLNSQGKRTAAELWTVFFSTARLILWKNWDQGVRPCKYLYTSCMRS